MAMTPREARHLTHIEEALENTRDEIKKINKWKKIRCICEIGIAAFMIILIALKDHIFYLIRDYTPLSFSYSAGLGNQEKVLMVIGAVIVIVLWVKILLKE